MTILHLIRSFGSNRPGGAEINLLNLSKISAKYLSTDNIIFSDYGIWKVYNSESNLKVQKYNKYSFILINICNLNFLSIRNIHIHSNGSLIFFGYILSIFLNAKLIIKVTRVGEKSLLYRDKENQFDFKIFINRYFLKLICNSKKTYLHLLTKSVRPISKELTENIIIFPNIIENGEYNKKLKIKNSFLISSRMIKRKNIDSTLNKLIEFNKIINIYVNIVGGGPELDRLKNKYKSFKKIIMFKGHINHSEIKYYYQISEFFINLSYSEGMSNSLIEAMSFGCRCIITDIPENRDTARENAVYFNKYSNFKEKFDEAKHLNCKQISKFSNNQYSIDNINLKSLKELYKVDNNLTSSW